MKTVVKICATVVALMTCFVAFPQTDRLQTGRHILVVTSYNPDTRSTSQNLSEFISMSRDRDPSAYIAVESINSLHLNEAPEWKTRMSDILAKYSGDDTPDVVVLLGQEAWSAFLSQDDENIKRMPAMCGMVSRNIITLPSDTVKLDRWLPESKDIMADFSDFNIVGGYAYEYDLDNNVGLVCRYFPEVDWIMFLTDNSFGGLNMLAWIKANARYYPDYKFEYMDGRVQTFFDANKQVGMLSRHSAIFCGTWRVDKTNDYALGSTTYVLREANPDIPVISLSTIGLGHWAFGGYVPEYKVVGGDLAGACFDYLDSVAGYEKKINIIPSHYVFDYERVIDRGIALDELPAGYELINRPLSFWSQYKYQVIASALILLVIILAFALTLRYMYRINKLKDALLVQREKLQIAKEQAEDASRMKSLFIQNINHEVRTPLNAIVGFAQIVARSEDPSFNKYSEIITANSYDLLKIIDDMMQLANHDTGLQLEKKEISVNALCEQAFLQSEYKRNADVEYRFVPWENEHLVMSYKNVILVVVSNLLHNAFKFTDEGVVMLRCGMMHDNRTVRITVSDTGPGIPNDKHEAVFERFTKLDGFKQGAGLGLAICREAARFIGGDVTIDPDYTSGCRVYFTFPV